MLYTSVVVRWTSAMLANTFTESLILTGLFWKVYKKCGTHWVNL